MNKAKILALYTEDVFYETFISLMDLTKVFDQVFTNYVDLVLVFDRT